MNTVNDSVKYKTCREVAVRGHCLQVLPRERGGGVHEQCGMRPNTRRSPNPESDNTRKPRASLF